MEIARSENSAGEIAGIPVRNLWLLMLYASQLFRDTERGKVAVEDNPDDIPDLVAEVLAHAVEKRLRRNLAFGYQPKIADLARVRGRIELLRTERSQLLRRGKVACSFESLTVNTPQNRYVRAALTSVARIVHRPDLAHRCHMLSDRFKRLGVSDERPTRAEVSTIFTGRKDANDELMYAAAKMAFEVVLPTEIDGIRSIRLPSRDIAWIRRLFEKAVGGFYEVVLAPLGWRVKQGQLLNWPIGRQTAGIARLLPGMRTDVVLTHQETRQRVVIDTKFTAVLTSGRFGENVLKSGYLYQIYAYLRSQEERGDPMSDRASGLLLHPAVGESIDEAVVVQGHAIRFATVDLAGTTSEIREQLMRSIDFTSLNFASRMKS